jgi:hypothetical protein
MRQTILLLVLVLALGFTGCGKQHGDLLTSFPLPLLDEATLIAGDEVHLAWSLADTVGVERYKIYVGLYVYGAEAAAVFDSTTAMEFDYVDANLSQVDPDLCAVGACDSVYKYTYFQISAVRGGVEGAPGPRQFPRW